MTSTTAIPALSPLNIIDFLAAAEALGRKVGPSPPVARPDDILDQVKALVTKIIADRKAASIKPAHSPTSTPD